MGTLDATLGEVIGIVAGSCGTDLNALVGGWVGVVQNWRLPGTFWVNEELRLTQALLKGSQ